VAQGNGMVITGTPADVLQPASQTSAAGQVALVHGDVGEGLQCDGSGPGIGAAQRPLGQRRPFLEPPLVGCRVRHRRPHLGGERLVLVDDVGELGRPLRRLGPQPAVGVQL
jgi:hypothetical protein